MAIFRQVQTSFWTDSRVLEELTPEDKFFYLYLLTNPHATQIGVYELPKKTMSFETGYTIESINALLQRFESHLKLIKYDAETREVALLNWGKYNYNRLGKPVEDLMKKELSDIRNKNLIEEVVNISKNEKVMSLYKDSLTTNDVTYHDTYDVTYPNKNKNNNKNNNNKKNNNNNNKEEEITTSSNNDFSNVQVFKQYEKCNFILSPMLIEKLAADIEIYGASEVIKSAEISDENGVHNYNYAKAIMEKRRTKGIDGSSKHNTESADREGIGIIL